ncbi:hypothetical protein LCGC14_1805750, partial [marine sediment metagenome]
SIVGLVSPALLLEQLTCSGYVTPIRVEWRKTTRSSPVMTKLANITFADHAEPIDCLPNILSTVIGKHMLVSTLRTLTGLALQQERKRKRGEKGSAGNH